VSGSRSRIRLVARREIVQRVRSRGFRVGTVLVALLAVTLVVLPSVLTPPEPSYRIGLTGEPAAALEGALALTARTFDAKIELERYPDAAAGERALRDGAADVLLVGSDEVVWKQEEDARLSAVVSTAVQAVKRQEAIATIGLTPEDAAALLAPEPPASRSLQRPDADRAGRELLAIVGLVLLFVALSIYGGFLVNGVVEEKANRVVEVLLSRVRPHELLAGKVLGIGLVGLGQLAVTGAVVLVALAAVGSADGPDSAPGMIAWVMLWFVLGYAFYSVVYAASGALASRQEDAQTVVVPVTMLMLTAYLVSFVAVEVPDGLVARLCSFLPPTAPFVMIVRQARGGVAWWETVLSASLLIVSSYGLIRLGGRVYAGAILRVGRRVTLRDAWRSSERRRPT
jgi:ABC-2 type transport system permease protein